MNSSANIDKQVNLYAPSYIFYSTDGNLSGISNEASILNVESLSSFNANVTINGNTNQYIYIALPSFIQMNRPTENYQPFKDKESGFTFSLSNSYYNNTATKTFRTLPGSNVVVNYTIVRSDQKLDAGVLWNIVSK